MALAQQSIVYSLLGLPLVRVVSLVVKAHKHRSEVSSTKPKMGAHHAEVTPEQCLAREVLAQ